MDYTEFFRSRPYDRRFAPGNDRYAKAGALSHHYPVAILDVERFGLVAVGQHYDSPVGEHAVAIKYQQLDLTRTVDDVLICVNHSLSSAVNFFQLIESVDHYVGPAFAQLLCRPKAKSDAAGAHACAATCIDIVLTVANHHRVCRRPAQQS
jgi:hypothetical protein